LTVTIFPEGTITRGPLKLFSVQKIVRIGLAVAEETVKRSLKKMYALVDGSGNLERQVTSTVPGVCAKTRRACGL